MGLTVRKRKGSKNWQIRGLVGRGASAVYVEESAGTADKRAAELLAKQRELEIVKGGVVGRGQGVTFLEGTVAYLETLGRSKTRKTAEQRRIVAKLLEHFKTTALNAIAQTEVEACVLALWPTAAKDTQRRYVGVIQAILNQCDARGRAGDPAFKGYTAPRIDKKKWPAGKGRSRWITPDEAARFLEHATPALAAAATFILYTGCRLSDALDLAWPSVNLTNRLAIFKDDKNGDDRQCHLPDPAFMALANIEREKTAAGTAVSGGRVFWMFKDKKALYTAWNAAREASGLKDVTPHIFCHTYATWLVEYGGANAKDLLETKRWKSLASVMRYLHAPEARVRAQINALPLPKKETA